MPRYAYMMLDHIEKDVSRQAMQLDTIGNFDKIFVERLSPRADKLEQRKARAAAKVLEKDRAVAEQFGK